MGKKSVKLPLIYLIGTIAVIVGCFCPIITISLGFLGKIDFTIIDAFKDLKDVDSWLALLMFVAAIIGAVFCFVGGKNVSLIKLVCIVASIVLGLVFFARGNFFKEWFKITGFGFYIIIAGWIVGLVGAITNK